MFDQSARTARSRLRALASLAMTMAGLGLLAAAPSALANSPSGDGAIIDNGTVQLGVNDWGNLNYDLPPDGGPPSDSGNTVVGLRFLRGGGLTPLEATADGCTCEGWGIADAGSGLTGYANDSAGYNGLSLVSFSSPDSAHATSVVRTTGAVSDGGGGGTTATDVDPATLPTLEVRQEYAPAPTTAFLYQDTVTVTNVGDVDATDLRYRRVMDWDIEPTAFDEFSTIGGTDTTSLLFSSDEGFDTSDPLGARSYYEEPQCSGTDTDPDTGETITENACTGFFTDAGPDDHGAHFDFGFGSLRAGEQKTFTIFYGAAGTESQALDALSAVNAEVYSLGQPDTDDGPSLGSPATFTFGFTTRTAADLRGPAPGMTLNAPAAVGLGTDGNPKPFALTARLHNYGAQPAHALRVALDLPDGLTLAGGTSPAALGDLAPGADTSATWTVRPVAACDDKTYTIGASGQWTEATRPLTSSRAVTVHGTCGRVFGVLTGFDRDGLRGLGGADVKLCPATGDCSTPVDETTTSGEGRYQFTVATPGSYRVMATPTGPFTDPASQTSGPLAVGVGSDREQDFAWENVDRLDADTTLGGPGLVGDDDGLPTIYWEAATTVTKAACPGGTTGERSARYRIVSNEDADGDGENDLFRDWTAMVLQPDGSFRATIPALAPSHGDAHFEFEVTCGSTVTPSGFDVYIDPSGVVVDQSGHPLPGATVTLYRFQGAAVGYVPVPNGSGVMSPANRTNPDVTDAAGHFGWDVLAGGYVVRAAKAGCRSPSNAAVPYVESAALTIPPPVTNLRLVLYCAPRTPPRTPPQGQTPPPAGGSSTTPQGPTEKGGVLPEHAKHKAAKAKIARAGKVKVRRRHGKATISFAVRASKAMKATVTLVDRKSGRRLKLAKGSKVGKRRLAKTTRRFKVKVAGGRSKVRLVTNAKGLKHRHRYAIQFVAGGKRVASVRFKG